MHKYYLDRDWLYIPLYFYFNNTGLSFPKLSCKDQCQIVVTLKENKQYYSKLIYKYFDLDVNERYRFMGMSHEYLIPTVNDFVYDFQNNNPTIQLPFWGSIKSIIFGVKNEPNAVNSAELYLDDKLIGYTNAVISTKTMMEIQNICDFATFVESGYQIFSFCLNLLLHQPSGTLPLGKSKLFVKLDLNCDSGAVIFFANSYNVMRIVKNRVGIAYYEQCAVSQNVTTHTEMNYIQADEDVRIELTQKMIDQELNILTHKPEYTISIPEDKKIDYDSSPKVLKRIPNNDNIHINEVNVYNGEYVNPTLSASLNRYTVETNDIHDDKKDIPNNKASYELSPKIKRNNEDWFIPLVGHAQITKRIPDMEQYIEKPKYDYSLTSPETSPEIARRNFGLTTNKNNEQSPVSSPIMNGRVPNTIVIPNCAINQYESPIDGFDIDPQPNKENNQI